MFVNFLELRISDFFSGELGKNKNIHASEQIKT